MLSLSILIVSVAMIAVQASDLPANHFQALDTGFYFRATESNKLSLNCSNGQTIVIDWASYGTPIGAGPFQVNQSCHNPNTFNIVVALCSGKIACDVESTNQQFIVDPCVGTTKTLAVAAHCA